mgnify:CR=1 FL=1
MNKIDPRSYIVSEKVHIGDNNYFAPFCVVGASPQHRNYVDKYKEVVIGNDNFIREFVTIYCGTERNTSVGNRNWIMSRSHIGHDVILEDDIVFSVGVSVAGWSHIMRGSNLGMGSFLHQGTVIGAYSMIGMSTIVTKQSDIKPFMKYIGSPARLLGPNQYAINKYPDEYKKIDKINEEFEKLKELR